MRRRVVLLAAALLTAAGCGGGAADTSAPTSDAVTSTTERQIPSNNTTTTKRPPPTSTTTTAKQPGLPSSFPIPDASIITLGPGSSISNGVSIVGVSFADVRAWLLQGLADGGYVVVGDDGASNVAFEGSGTSGTAVITQHPDEIDVELTLGARG